MSVSNPWLSTEEDPGTESTPAQRSSEVVQPLWNAGITSVPAVSWLDPKVVTDHIPMWFVGAHGGAGSTTLSRVLMLGDAGQHWPVSPSYTTHAIVVARRSLSGLRAAQKAAIQWVSGAVPRVQLHGLVLVPDAPGKRPKELAEFEHLVSGAFPAVWTVNYVNQWRFKDAWDCPMDRSYKALSTSINTLISEGKE